MNISIKNLIPLPRARAFKINRWQGDATLAPPRPMHETKRIILKKLSARMKAGHGFVA